MTDLTPPPMSENEIVSIRKSTRPGSLGAWADSIAFARAIETHVNEQWRQRLEIAGYLVHGGRAFVDKAFTSRTGAELSASERKDGASVAPLYRIKEQG